MTRLKGTITLNFEDTDLVARDLYAVKNATLDIVSDGVTAQNASAINWRNSYPEMNEWSVAMRFNADQADDGTPHISQSEIEALCFTSTVFAVTFTSPNGATYEGSAFIQTYTLDSADQKAYDGSVVLAPTTKLTITQPDCPRVLASLFYTTDPTGSDDGELREVTL